MDRTARNHEFKNRLYKFTLQLIEFIDGLSKDNVSRRLGDQLLRSGTSVIANYVEGYAGSSKKDFAKYLNISLKSANESILWLEILRDSKRATDENTKWLISELNEFSRILAASLITLRKNIKNNR